MRRGLKRAVDGIGWYVAGAAVLVAVALMSFLLIIQSQPDHLQWTGARVVGQEKQGLVFYSYQGNTETLDVPGFATKSHYVVIVDKSDPTSAEPYELGTRIEDGLFILGPLALAGLLISIGAFRRRRERKRGARSDGFGQGLDDEFVRRKLSELRGNQPNR